MNDNQRLPSISIIETERLILWPITLKDAPALFNYAKDQAIAKFVSWHCHETIDDSIKFIKCLITGYETHNTLMWAVQLKSDKSNTIIGTCGFACYYDRIKCLEVSYAFNPKVWGKGYAKEALLAVINYGFEFTDAIRMEGICVVNNIASAKTLSSVGMQLEGILRSNFIKNGKISDCKIFSIIRSEYIK